MSSFYVLFNLHDLQNQVRRITVTAPLSAFLSNIPAPHRRNTLNNQSINLTKNPLSKAKLGHYRLDPLLFLPARAISNLAVL
ncbi:hypothetical protein B4P00_13090 [Shewanella xiamenensis]|nr:hypothetical protein [Shewanella xiamenensis]